MIGVQRENVTMANYCYGFVTFVTYCYFAGIGM